MLPVMRAAEKQRSAPYITTDIGTAELQRRAFQTVYNKEGSPIGFVMVSASVATIQRKKRELEKGIQRQTLDHIRADLRKNAGAYRTAEQIAADTGLSKVTVRRYLNYLIGTSEAESQVDYSTGGRPRVECRSR